MRAAWTGLSDEQLLAQCEVDTYRASGPGGQKRNKTSSAVRLRHPPSGLIVIAEESRSQHENRARALRRLRQALYLKLRDEVGREYVALWSRAGERFAAIQPTLPRLPRCDIAYTLSAFTRRDGQVDLLVRLAALAPVSA